MYVMVTDRPLDEIFCLALMKIDMLFYYKYGVTFGQRIYSVIF